MAMRYSHKYRVLRPFGDVKEVGGFVVVADKVKVRYLTRERFIEPVLTDADDGINIAHLYAIAKSTTKKLPDTLEDVSAGTIREALKHETRTGTLAILEAKLTEL